MEMSLKQSSERIKDDSEGFGHTGLQDDTNPGFKTREQNPEENVIAQRLHLHSSGDRIELTFMFQL